MRVIGERLAWRTLGLGPAGVSVPFMKKSMKNLRGKIARSRRMTM